MHFSKWIVKMTSEHGLLIKINIKCRELRNNRTHLRIFFLPKNNNPDRETASARRELKWGRNGRHTVNGPFDDMHVQHKLLWKHSLLIPWKVFLWLSVQRRPRHSFVYSSIAVVNNRLSFYRRNLQVIVDQLSYSLLCLNYSTKNNVMQAISLAYWMVLLK